MQLDLREIIHRPGEKKSFAYDLDLRAVSYFGEQPFAHPVKVSGTVRNAAGALELTGEAQTAIETRCDRCLKPLSLSWSVPVETLLAEELEDEESDEIVLLDKGVAELDELFTTAAILALDSKHLCREDCKGLCPTCGKDLNEGPCTCGKELDPRLAVLAKLLDKGSQDKDEEA